jgi:hypothetical protein
MDMVKLYIQYKVADYRGEDTYNHLKEIEDAFEKIQKRYKRLEIMTLQKQKEYQLIWWHYVLYNGNSPFKCVKVEYV